MLPSVHCRPESISARPIRPAANDSSTDPHDGFVAVLEHDLGLAIEHAYEAVADDAGYPHTAFGVKTHAVGKDAVVAELDHGLARTEAPAGRIGKRVMRCPMVSLM